MQCPAEAGASHVMLELNSLVPGKFSWNLRYVVVKPIVVIDGWGMADIHLVKLPWDEHSLDLTDGKTALIQVMAWCRQATSHYLRQCWQILYRHIKSLGHNGLNHWGAVIYASTNCFINDWGNGLAPVRQQHITWADSWSQLSVTKVLTIKCNWKYHL